MGLFEATKLINKYDKVSLKMIIKPYNVDGEEVFFVERINKLGRKDGRTFVPIYQMAGRYAKVRTTIGSISFPAKYHGKKFRLIVDFINENQNIYK